MLAQGIVVWSQEVGGCVCLITSRGNSCSEYGPNVYVCMCVCVWVFDIEGVLW